MDDVFERYVAQNQHADRVLRFNFKPAVKPVPEPTSQESEQGEGLCGASSFAEQERQAGAALPPPPSSPPPKPASSAVHACTAVGFSIPATYFARSYYSHNPSCEFYQIVLKQTLNAIA